MSTDVMIRELHEIDEFKQVSRLFDDIWHPDPSNVPVTMELLIAFAHTGNYVVGAYAGDTLVGASVGFRAAGGALHSHVTGARTGRGIGYAIKSHQRAWCLERGLERVTWTFDPLVRRNARFNLVKLGALPQEYLENFYGVMADAINEGDTSDRLLALWEIGAGSPGAGSPGAGSPGAGALSMEAGPALSAGTDGRPVTRTVHGNVLLAGTPADVERLRREDPAAAKAWRGAMREVLGGAMKTGGQVVGFTDKGEYVVVLN
ncbi:GNAT family N-acetyltransferase [Nonomuraea sp. NPDC002799]